MFGTSRPSPAPPPAPRFRRGARVLAVVVPLLALIFVAAGLASRPVSAQEYQNEAERWAYKLIEASYAVGVRERVREPIDAFGGIIRVPPTWSYLFEGAVVRHAHASRRGDSYEIGLELPDGGVVLIGMRGRGEYDKAVASLPPGCTTRRGRERGYCVADRVRDRPYYQYFPDLAVGEHPALAAFGDERDVGASVILGWYDAAADMTYAFRLAGPDGLVARAGFGPADDEQRDPERNAEAARRLANTASRFLGVDLSLYPG